MSIEQLIVRVAMLPEAEFARVWPQLGEVIYAVSCAMCPHSPAGLSDAAAARRRPGEQP